MSSLLDAEEVDREGSDITLSTASLLGIFFGLVLVCGVFFGFGYSLGRRASDVGLAGASAATGTNDSPPAPLKTIAPPALQNGEERDEAPSPASAELSSPAPAPEPVTLPVVEPSVDTPRGGGSARVAASAPPISGSPKARAQKAAAAPDGGRHMVQIAAVSRQDDADVLVSALRQRGYQVMVRSEPQDKLLHVQVGPFASRAEAAAMKEKLRSDGYNAIIKE